MPSLGGLRVALVGGAGFIGHHLALRLKAEGAEVHIIDDFVHNSLAIRLASGRSDLMDRSYQSILQERLDLLRGAAIRLHAIDASNTQCLAAALDEIQPTVLAHLAAIASAELTELNPRSAFDCSLKSLLNCLEISGKHIERFLYFSSSMVYGDFLSGEVNEDHPTNPRNLYGAVKLVGERLVMAQGKKSALPYVIIRPSALYGPRCVSGRIVERLLTNAMYDLPLTIAGDGTGRLDFTYVDDLLNGICLTIQKPQAVQQVFNLTYGRARTLLELAEIVRLHFPKSTITYYGGQDTKPRRGTLSIRKAADLLEYSPEFDLERGIPVYLKWMESAPRPSESLCVTYSAQES
jgi:nucleoside-diphosphate-sugar epimerase